MCTRPKTFNEQKVACRECDQCIGARKNTWIARAMAEKATAGNALVFTLTYANLPNGEKPLGARVFHYSQIQNFLKTVREAYFRKYAARNEISFLVAGEQGSKGTKRVHWHLILFSDKSLDVLGKWTNSRGQAIEFSEIQSLSKDHRIHWSAWPHGHINVLTPDQKGMSYVLKYALKDQFNVVKSANHARVTKAENHAASKLVMSKNPPLGQRFLEKQLTEWEDALQVPVSLNIPVPDYTGYWYLQGAFRAYAMERLHAINETRKQKYGSDCPQWAALLASATETDFDGLYYGRQEEKEEWQSAWDLSHELHEVKREFEKRKAERANIYLTEKVIRRCGHIRPCDRCAETRSDAENAEFEKQYTSERRLFFENNPDKSPKSGDHDFKKYWLARYQISGGCRNRSDQWLQRLFKTRKAASEFYSIEGHGSKTKGRN